MEYFDEFVFCVRVFGLEKIVMQNTELIEEVVLMDLVSCFSEVFFYILKFFAD